jgi:hypothetical protein
MIEAIIRVIRHHGSVIPATILQRICENHQLVSAVLGTLNCQTEEGSQQSILNVFLRHVTDATPADVSGILPNLAEFILPLLSSEIVPLRRTAIFILVECKIKLPREFVKVAATISTTHQKLIDLYTSRRK